jgi:hypothetical protein
MSACQAGEEVPGQDCEFFDRGQARQGGLGAGRAGAKQVKDLSTGDRMQRLGSTELGDFAKVRPIAVRRNLTIDSIHRRTDNIREHGLRGHLYSKRP